MPAFPILYLQDPKVGVHIVLSCNIGIRIRLWHQIIARGTTPLPTPIQTGAIHAVGRCQNHTAGAQVIDLDKNGPRRGITPSHHHGRYGLDTAFANVGLNP